MTNKPVIARVNGRRRRVWYPGPGSTIGAAMTFGYIIGERVAASVRQGLVPA